MLDELDKELEKRNHKFCRYADDCNIYVKSEKAGIRVKASITKYLETKLKLKVNEAKSAVDKPFNRKFLGFSFALVVGEVKIIISKPSLKRVKDKIREFTNAVGSRSIEDRIKSINRYIIGWLGYYSLSEIPRTICSLESWLRRRLRMCQWHDWKKPKTRIRELINLGLSTKAAYKMGNSRKGDWRSSRTSATHRAMGVAYWIKLGLEELETRYFVFRESWRTAVY